MSQLFSISLILLQLTDTDAEHVDITYKNKTNERISYEFEPYFVSNQTVFTGHTNEQVTLSVQFCCGNDNGAVGNISVIWSLLGISLHQGAR